MKKVDLVIPTFNRVNFLNRILDYYKECGKDFNFIIADSSSIKNKILNKEIIKKYPSLNILHLDIFPETMPQHQKFIEMVKYIQSKYCVFCADDDFVTPNGIKECVNFLEKNPDYSAAHGSYISFYIKQNFFGTYFFHWRKLFSPLTLDNPKSINRVSVHLSDFILNLWAVRKTESVKSAYEEFSEVQFNSYTLPIFGELLPDCLIAVYGKIKSLDTLYGARQCFSQINSTYFSLIDADRINKYEPEYEKFKGILLKNIIENSPSSSVKDISQKLNAAIESYFKYSYQEHLQNKIYRTLEKYPKFITKLLKSFHILYLFSKKKDSKMGLVDQSTSIFFNDFKKIKDCVLKYGEI